MLSKSFKQFLKEDFKQFKADEFQERLKNVLTNRLFKTLIKTFRFERADEEGKIKIIAEFLYRNKMSLKLGGKDCQQLAADLVMILSKANDNEFSEEYLPEIDGADFEELPDEDYDDIDELEEDEDYED